MLDCLGFFSLCPAGRNKPAPKKLQRSGESNALLFKEKKKQIEQADSILNSLKRESLIYEFQFDEDKQTFKIYLNAEGHQNLIRAIEQANQMKTGNLVPHYEKLYNDPIIDLTPREVVIAESAFQPAPAPTSAPICKERSHLNF